MNLVQFLDEGGARRVAVPDRNGAALRIVGEVERVYDLVLEAASQAVRLEALVKERLTSAAVSYDAVISEKRLLPPIDHADPAHCIVTGTGLTHLGSAQSRDAMHVTLEAEAERLSDSMKMFKLGLEGGKPLAGKVGVQPEWFYKGDGQCIVPPEQPLIQPSFAEDGGEEAELAALYVIADNGDVLRVGFALGNEFADHVLEKQNYLYLAHSKLRTCSLGPEVRLGELPEHTSGNARIVREGRVVWSAEMLTGEANMSHSLANLEHGATSRNGKYRTLSPAEWP
jgi:hypothetical protein